MTAPVKTCRLCGQELPLTEFYFDRIRARHRTECSRCKVARQRVYYNKRKESGAEPAVPEHSTPVADPVHYLLLGVLERAYMDLAAFGTPLPENRQAEAHGEVTDIPAGCDQDARDALRWFASGDAEYLVEEVDIPAHWVRAEMAARLATVEVGK